MTDARFLRQVLVPEVGEAGQSAISRAAARVAGDGFAHEVAERYATRAGFAAVEAGSIDVRALAPESIVYNEAAADVFAGARSAVRAIRSAIEKR